MADNRPTFHHLNNSQSQRILWLLEELNIEYNLVLHERNPPNHPTRPFLSPPSLVATGPYGKAPVLITGPKDGNRYIPESSAIATYIIRTFDKEDKFGLRNGGWIRDEMLCSVVATNLQRATFIYMMLDMGMLKNGEGARGKGFDGPALRVVLNELERELKEGPEGGFFMGKEPGRSDILLEYPMSSIKQRGTVDLKSEFPGLDKWLERVCARDAYKRGLEKGNGYDLTIFPRGPHL